MFTWADEPDVHLKCFLGSHSWVFSTFGHVLSSDPSSQSFLPSHTCLWWMHLLPRLQARFGGKHVVVVQSRSSAPFGQSGSPSHRQFWVTHFPGMPQWKSLSPGHFVLNLSKPLQWNSSEPSAQSLNVSHRLRRETHFLSLVHLNSSDPQLSRKK